MNNKYNNLLENQPKVVKLIQNSIKKNRLVNVYLFSGPRGSLKREAANYLANLILCDDHNNCGKCYQCERLEKGINENLFYIEPDGEQIKKDQITELEHEFMMTSSHSRVFIINQIDKVNPTAGNTLLKFLEELDKDSYGILLTEQLSSVLPTICSRSQVINFLPLDYAIISKKLVEEGIDKESAKAISKLTNNYDEAIKYANDQNIMNIIQVVREICIGIEGYGNAPALVLNSTGKFLILFNNRELYNILMDLMIIMQNDKVLKGINSENELIFGETLEKYAIMHTIDEQLAILEKMLSYKQKMRYNINIEMMFYQMFIEIERMLA